LDAGHFALDLKPREIIRLTQDFMAKASSGIERDRAASSGS
jgi:hypothetical protein